MSWSKGVPLLALLFAMSPGIAGKAEAHALSPSLLELKEAAGGRVELMFKTPSRVPVGSADLRPELPPSCRPLEPASVTEDGPATIVRWAVDCGETGLTGAQIGIAGLAERSSDALVRVHLADGRLIRDVLSGRRPSLVVPEEEKTTHVGIRYLVMGAVHILLGLDHLLFVLGLLLLVRGGRALIATITAFTLGHSVTLALAALGWLVLPPAPVEVAIALSILILAVELARNQGQDQYRQSSPPRTFGLTWAPWKLAVGFGLLHGLGFAGALVDVGLPRGEIPLALLSFNLGIEAGQLLFVGAVLALAWGSRPLAARLPSWSLQVPAYVLGTLAAFWIFERSAWLFQL